ncbi:hypothetical protein FDN13_11010 [Caloramator sp. E03]|uniref:hypothetical protein n=1 Tax=Caloramator sp. E03 TaxID=2576307 RepID=UPI0011107085|nr:hypothetical protein [Caloramator sp. E03]QCX34189.1 hypothetical protein FDN13_11010 [Caloramator sp. E03]
MEKFLTILKIIISIVLVFIVGIFIIIFYESGKAEKDYQSSINYMKYGNWGKALEHIQLIPFYKDANDIYIYVYPNKIFYDKYSNDDEAIESYKKAIAFINSNKTKLKSLLKDNYTKDLNELLLVLNFKINELNAKNQEKAVKDDFNNAIELIKKGNLQSAQNKLMGINSTSLINKKEELLNYINLLNAIKIQGNNKKDNKQIIDLIAKLDPNYNGELSEDIKKVVQGYIDINKWSMLYEKKSMEAINISNEGAVLSASLINNEVKIGLTRQKVINIMGNPIKDNIINTNRYGIYEEMSFSNGRTIFLENNIVVVIKG